MSNPRHLASLTPEQKRALLARMLEERAAKPRRFPLSFAQQRLWFIEQLEPGSAAYHVWSALRVRGPLDPGVLVRVVREIVRRHQTLRTTFAMVDTEPVQVVAPTGEPALLLADFRGVPEERREEEARRAGQAALHVPFDLAHGPLLRLFALRIADCEVLLYMAMHHIVSDGWSLGLWVQELAALYDAFAAGRPSPLPPLPLQYGDFAQWQRQHLAGERLERLIGWWRDRLAGAPAVLELPTDRPRPAVQSFRGSSVSFSLPRELSERLAALGQREGATLFMVLLAGFQLLLSRYSRQEDISVGTPTAGRGREELEGLIGFFASMLVLRTDLSGDPPLRELLRRVRETALGTFEHQEVPFEKLVEALQPPRDASHTPLFQVEFVLQNTPEPSLRAQDLTLAPLGVERETAKFDLLLEMFESPTGLYGILEYNRDLFDRSTAARLTRHFERLLAAIAAAPETPIARLSLLPEAERHQVLAEWNDTAQEWSGFRSLHGMFEGRVREQPEAPAATFEEESLTYRELSARANQLAHHLRRLGVGPDVKVAVCLERSLDLVTSFLGVLKAGGAYVPIDPDYPADRRAFLLADSHAAALVTDSRWLADLPPGGPPPVLLDRDRTYIRSESTANLAGGATAESLAYVIYTSGSTGQPKGAMIHHRGIHNRLLWMQEAYGLTPRDTVLQKTPFSFDVSVWEFFWPLLAGARLVLARPGGHRDSAYLAELIGRERVTVMHFVPSMLQAFLEEPDLSACASLRLVVASGEALPPALAQRFAQRLPGTDLQNLYGPTETSVDVTSWGCPSGEAPAVVPIGRPIANTRIHLLDPAFEPVPIGVPGELWIGGLNVGRGYLARPSLTAERFVPDPFGGPGERLYRTGDLARIRGDGEIEYLGRIDFQVKVRGFRIELGEIEAALAAHPEVREAVVLTREDQPGDPRLVAYVVSRAEAAGLREHLRGRLPEYMIPAFFVMLNALPLSPNGKVDRKSLPAPQGQSPEQGYLAIRTPVEEILAGIWAELLGVERVGAADHFFALGGHSLLAMRVLSRLRALFGVEIPLRDLFEAPKLADLAARIETAQRAGAGPIAPPLVPVPRSGPVPLSFAQQRLWFIDRLKPGSPVYNMPLSLGLQGALSVPTLAASLAEVARRHEALRTTFAAAEGRPFQVISAEPRLDLPQIDLSGLPREARQGEARALLATEAVRPFDLESGPLVRTLLLRLADDEHAALLNLHHIVSDGWSVGVLVREVSALYSAVLRGEPSPLPELTIQYADYALWQRGWLQGEALEAQLAWWRQELAGAPALLEFPTDRPRPPVPSYRGAAELISFDPPLARTLAELAQREGATLFMVLLAGFQALLHRHGGGGDLVTGTPVANRNHAEVENLIGFFVNTLALRARIAPGLPFREALARARTAALGAYAHQELPFERLVDDLAVERSLAHSPLFQVMLVLQNAPLETLDLPGLTLIPVAVPSQVAKFDLTLSVSQAGDGLVFVLEHATDLFDRSTARRLLEHLRTLLEGAAVRPDLPLADLPLLSAAEAEELRAWSQGAPAVAGAPTAPELFAAQAERAPTAPALLQGEERITYGELAHRAEELARHLRSLGIGPESLAALCFGRSPRLVEAVLGTLFAGGAYLPLDPDYPPERLRLLLEDSGARFLLTTSGLAGRLSALAGPAVRIVPLDREWTDGSSQGFSPALPPLHPEQLAYVIYTSGSTGRPKGVQVRHGGIPNLAAAQRRAFDVGPGGRVLQFSSPSFDASVWEMWMALASGAALVLAPREELLPGPGLLALLGRQGITHATLPPTALAALPVGAPEQLPALRVLIVAGEPCPVPLARLWAPGRRFFNAYGPTESTVCTTLHETTGHESERVPIGLPLPGMRVHVLGPGLAAVPVGVPGELLLGGIALARGYLDRPEVTAERFVPDPFGDRPGDRLYRTGDLVRWRLDGALDFVGRVDDQVKVRGFRIEPGEIEAALALHPAVREAAVSVRPDRRGDGILVAWVTAEAASPPSVAELRGFLRGRLPEFMIPSAFVVLDTLPLNPHGKVDRRSLSLPAPDEEARERPAYAAPANEIERQIAAAWQEVLGVERVGLHDNFFDLGGHSLRLVEVHARLLRDLGRDISIVTLFQYPTVAALAAHLASNGPAAVASPIPPRERVDGRPSFAIIGMSGSFPGAADLDQLWDNLCRGVESIRRLTDDELLAAGVSPETLASGRYVKAASEVANVDLFDAEFFGLSPREAEALDPQQRLFLEHAWQALEHAGYDSRRPSGPVGVYAGSQMSTYLFNILSRPDIADALGPFALQLSVDKEYVATRTSYTLDLKGPSVAVQTSCSTSLVAVHFACQALANRECDMALAGGVAVRAPLGVGYLYQDAGILSPDGHCRAFDATARGTVPGTGVGIVVLKRLEDALRGGDTIHAVVRGTAINNDGALKVGFTAPGVEGQAQVIAASQAAAGVHPDSVTYVEAHGTGTQLGDPIEVAALTRAFRAGGSQRTGFCALGSIKTNIGHLDTAAGVAGFLKAALALKHRQIPPSLHYEQPNPAIDVASSPFYVNTWLADWPTDGDTPRRAGVSSFGIGGTNAHVVLEEAPEPHSGGPSRPWQLLLLSARTPAALEEATDRMAEFLTRHPKTRLADACYTLQVGRRPFLYRRALVCATPEEAAAVLLERDPERLATRRAAERRPVVFLFPGQGAQHPGMGRDLYASESVFRRALDECAETLAPRLGCDLRTLLYPPAGEPASAAERELRQTRYAQPALFAVEHALARLWLSWGLEPTALLGHSLGEYVAACLAGVLSLEDALDLVATRGELMQELPPGAMLAIGLPETEIAPELVGSLALAAVNGPEFCVASGPEEEIAELERRLASRGAVARRLHTSHAFHSAMMEPVLAPFAERVARVTLRAPAVPYLSNLTGTWITAEQATDPAYWVRHLRETVRFGPGLERLLAEADEGLTLLEIGPGRTLGELVRRQLPPGSGHDVVASLRHPREEGFDLTVLLRALGRLWMAGAVVDWPAFWAGEERRRIPLPTYPFQRRRYWIERRIAQAVPTPQAAAVAATAEPSVIEPPAGHARPDLSTSYVAPCNATEQRLAAIWQELLGIAEIGSHDDFFELGGHSLLATRLLARVRQDFGREIPLESVFTAPTLARFAALLEADVEEPLAPPITPIPRTGDLPLSFAQQRLLFLALMAPEDPSYNLPLGLRLKGPLAPGALRLALEQAVARHETLRTTFRIDEDRVTQVIAPPAPFPLPLADLSDLPEEDRLVEAQRLGLEQSRHTFDLLRGPVLIALLMRMAPDEHRLLLNLHHIAADGWSFGVLYRDAIELYDAAVRGRAPRLPELTVQYADFAAWQQARLQDESLARQIDYWRTRLAGTPSNVLPTDRPRPPVASGRGSAQPVTLAAETVAAAHRLARAEDATLFMVLLAAFVVTLHRASGSEDLLVGTDIANRTQRETEDLIGLFVNQLVLRNDLSGDPTFRELLRRVRRTTLDAYAHQDAPFDRLVETLNPVRDLGSTPLFQIKLVLQNARLPVRELGDLMVSPLGVHNQTAKFDLLLNLVEVGDAVSGALEYRADLWDEASMARLLADFAAALAAGTSRPDERLSRIEAELSRPLERPAGERRTVLRRRAIAVPVESKP